MTMILSWLTQSYVLQVSDRRLTFITGPKKIKDDDTNKAVLFDNRVAFAYTGLGEIQNQKTDAWLTKVLVDADTDSLDKACKVVSTQATAAFRRIDLPPEIKRHTFVGIGWDYTGSPKDPLPVATEISNQQDSFGKPSKVVHKEFRVFSRILAEPMMWGCTGQYPGQSHTKQLHRLLCEMLERGVHAPTVARFLAYAIREVAKTNDKVGRNLMISYIPRAAVIARSQAQCFITAGVIRPDRMSFLYLSDDSSKLVYYGPNIVRKGVAFLGFKAEP